MLSVNLLEKYFEAARFERILEGVLDNGLELPLSLRIRLSQSHFAAAALGLRRVVELTYVPTSLSREMTHMLLEAQEPNGSYGYDPLTTATVAAALGKVLREHHDGDQPEVTRAYHGAMAALGAMQDDRGLFVAVDDRDEQQRALTGAFILWLLADDEPFRESVRLAELLDWFESNSDRLDRGTLRLWQMARVSFTRRQAPVPSPQLMLENAYEAAYAHN